MLGFLQRRKFKSIKQNLIDLGYKIVKEEDGVEIDLGKKEAYIDLKCFPHILMTGSVGVDNTFRLYRKYVGLNDELFNLELVKVERALRTFEEYCVSGCEVLVKELKEVLGV